MDFNKHEIINYYLIKKNYRLSKIEDDNSIEELKKKFSVRGNFFKLLFGFRTLGYD